MPKKNWTDEERAAFGAKMKAAKAATSKNKNPQTEPTITGTTDQPSTVVIVEEPQTTISQEDVSSLLNRIQELEAAQWRNANANQMSGSQFSGATATTQGLIGTMEKYPTDPAKYPNPTTRLAEEARLQRFAFKDNYELDYSITMSSYETIDGIRMKEPKFILDLIRVLYDEATGQKTDGRYTVCRLIVHEDPEAALVVARDNGVEVDETDETLFLNEMRYLRMRDWLLESFYPPVSMGPKKNKKEMVINGKLVEYFEVNNENSDSIPFEKLDSKV